MRLMIGHVAIHFDIFQLIAVSLWHLIVELAYIWIYFPQFPLVPNFKKWWLWKNSRKQKHSIFQLFPRDYWNAKNIKMVMNMNFTMSIASVPKDDNSSCYCCGIPPIAFVMITWFVTDNVLHSWLRKVLASEKWPFSCQVPSHWLKSLSATDRNSSEHL